jgi:DNA-binding protein HU-beta
MNKSNLVAFVAAKANLSKRVASRVVDSFIDGVVMSLQKGESVALPGFGTFSIDVCAG